MTPFYLWSKFMKKIRGKAVRNSEIDKTAIIGAGSHIINSKISRHSFCGYDCKIYNTNVGPFCSIADNVSIGVSQHPIDWVSTSPAFVAGQTDVKKNYAKLEHEDGKRTIIGPDVWIGERAIIKQGLSIGAGSIIGMGSVVTKDVMPYTIVGGCPAKVIRKRFREEVITELLTIEWWEFNDEDLMKYASYFKKPEEFIRRFHE